MIPALEHPRNLQERNTHCFQWSPNSPTTQNIHASKFQNCFKIYIMYRLINWESDERIDGYHVAAKLSIVGIDSHDRGSGEDQLWLPRQRHELHYHRPPRRDLVRTCLHQPTLLTQYYRDACFKKKVKVRPV